jgi:hypothetical protein
MSGDPYECRKHAQRCLEVAKVAPSSFIANHFEDLARHWLRVADNLEQLLPLVKDRRKSPRPNG